MSCHNLQTWLTLRSSILHDELQLGIFHGRTRIRIFSMISGGREAMWQAPVGAVREDDGFTSALVRRVFLEGSRLLKFCFFILAVRWRVCCIVDNSRGRAKCTTCGS